MNKYTVLDTNIEASCTSGSIGVKGQQAARTSTCPTFKISHLAMAVAGALTLGMPGAAWAACTSGNGVNYTCSGVTASAQTIDGSNLVVNVDSSFNADVPDDGSPGLQSPALYIRNATGDVDVTAAGRVKDQTTTVSLVPGGGGGALANSGPISIYNSGTGSVVMDQSASSVLEGQSGGLAIYNNASSSTTTATLSGRLSSGRMEAVYIRGKPLTTIVTQEATGDISAAGTGIWITEAASANVKTLGKIAAGAWGVMVQVDSDLTVNQVAGSIQSSQGPAIGTAVSSTGVTRITTNAVVEALNGIGISAIGTTANAKQFTIDQVAGRVMGTQGIVVRNLNPTLGSTAINVAGVVTASGSTAFTDQVSRTQVLVGPPPTGTRTITEYSVNARPAAIGVAAEGGVATIDLKAGADVQATGQGLAIRGYRTKETVTLRAGSKVTGGITLGAGDDQLTIFGNADIIGVPLIDGGSSLYNEERIQTVYNYIGNIIQSGPTVLEAYTDLLGTPTAATNKLNFDAATQSLAGSIMKNWQTVALSGSNVTFTGDAALVTGTGTNPDASLQGVVLQSSTLASPVALAVRGDVSIDSASTLRHAIGGSITGKVSNAGTVYWGNLNQTLQVVGDYAADAAAKMSLESVLADDSSATDRLHVTGNTSGTTEITVRPAAGSAGALTSTGILVVQVDGNSDGLFVLSGGSVNAGGFTYSLNKVGKNWYLQSIVAPQINVTCIPATLKDSAGQVSTCTVTSSTPAPAGGMSINLTPPLNNERYSATCASPIIIPAGASVATCDITATPNTVAGDGNVSALVQLLPGSDYVLGSQAQATVTINDDDQQTQPPTATPVPTLGQWAMVGLSTLLALLGVGMTRRRTRE